jgi:hypothetical protein
MCDINRALDINLLYQISSKELAHEHLSFIADSLIKISKEVSNEDTFDLCNESYKRIQLVLFSEQNKDSILRSHFGTHLSAEEKAKSDSDLANFAEKDRTERAWEDSFPGIPVEDGGATAEHRIDDMTEDDVPTTSGGYTLDEFKESGSTVVGSCDNNRRVVRRNRSMKQKVERNDKIGDTHDAPSEDEEVCVNAQVEDEVHVDDHGGDEQNVAVLLQREKAIAESCRVNFDVNGDALMALDTNMNRVAAYALSRIFSPAGKEVIQLDRLVSLAVDYINIVSVVSKYNTLLAAKRLDEAKENMRDCVDFDIRTSWGTICKKIIAVDRACDKSSSSTLSPSVERMIDDAKSAVARHENEKAGKTITSDQVTYSLLKLYTKLGRATRHILCNLLHLAMVHVVMSRLTIDQLFDGEEALDLATKLSSAVRPGQGFNAKETVLKFMETAIHVGLRSVTHRHIAYKVMLEVKRELSVVTRKPGKRRDIIHAYHVSTRMNSAGESVAQAGASDYCEDNQARKRMIALFFFYFAFDALKSRFECLIEGDASKYNIISMAPDSVRKTFLDNFFDIDNEVSVTQNIKENLKACAGPIQERPLLYQNLAQISAMERIIELAGHS